MTRPFRILTLDGGGIMGAFSASALATFERVTGRRIVDHFDLIAETSTGGIIAIGLAMGASAKLVNMGRQIAELNKNMNVVTQHFVNREKVEPFRPYI